jgi:anti-sigma regulatory factor (Ser/Thr protein kinase)
MPSLSLEIANDIAALSPASERLRAFLEEVGAPGEAAFLADLVVEELVSNTIKYGYEDAGAPHCAHVGVLYEDGLLTIEVRDAGRPFDPLEADAPDFSLPAEERPIGGLGIHLVRQMTDELRYERRGHENVVVATKRFGGGP